MSAFSGCHNSWPPCGERKGVDNMMNNKDFSVLIAYWKSEARKLYTSAARQSDPASKEGIEVMARSLSDLTLPL
jgi:hypothetical protein